MDKVITTYIVWHWDSRARNYRLGKTFKYKKAAENFADNLKHWEYIGITVSIEIIGFDVV